MNRFKCAYIRVWSHNSIFTLGINIFDFVYQILSWILVRFYIHQISTQGINHTHLNFLTCLYDGTKHLILHFPVRPFSGLAGNVDTNSIIFTPGIWSVWNLTIVNFTFSRCVVQHINISDKWLETYFISWQGPAQYFPFFYTPSHLGKPHIFKSIISTNIYDILVFK